MLTRKLSFSNRKDKNVNKETLLFDREGENVKVQSVPDDPRNRPERTLAAGPTGRECDGPGQGVGALKGRDREVSPFQGFSDLRGSFE